LNLHPEKTRLVDFRRSGQADVKSNAVGHRRPHTQEEMVQNVRSYLFNRQKSPQIVKKYFEAESVPYAAV